MFSKYPDALGVMCIIKEAPWQFGLTPDVTGGHSSGVSDVPAAPPMRAWQSTIEVSQTDDHRRGELDMYAYPRFPQIPAWMP